MDDDKITPGPIQAHRHPLNDPSGVVITRGGVALTLAKIEALALFFERATGGLNAADVSVAGIDNAIAKAFIAAVRETDGFVQHVLAEIGDEYARAVAKFPRPQASAHEGYAVLREEVDELWDDIKANKPAAAQHKEAVQVAAMALRFVVDSVARQGAAG